MPKLLTTQEAAEMLHVSEQTVRGYIKQGLLAAQRPEGTRRWLIAEDDLRAFVERPPRQEAHE